MNQEVSPWMCVSRKVCITGSKINEKHKHPLAMDKERESHTGILQRRRSKGPERERNTEAIISGADVLMDLRNITPEQRWYPGKSSDRLNPFILIKVQI